MLPLNIGIHWAFFADFPLIQLEIFPAFQLRLKLNHPRANNSLLSPLPLKAAQPCAIQGLRLSILGNQSSTILVLSRGWDCQSLAIIAAQSLCYLGAKIANPWQSKQHNLVLSLACNYLDFKLILQFRFPLPLFSFFPHSYLELLWAFISSFRWNCLFHILNEFVYESGL